MKRTIHLPLCSLALASLTVLASPVANANCGCPSDKNGAPSATSIGLGEAMPDASNLSAHPDWKVYRFDRDGISYLQINDRYNNVRAAVGIIGSTFWVLPVGSDADRVATPGDPMPIGAASWLFRTLDAEITLHRDGTVERWSIRAPGAEY